jgi:transcriptional regulator with XRE-family HTH domain
LSIDPTLATPEELCHELGRRLRAQRLSRLLTQEELAARAGLSPGALKKLERDGQGHVLTLVRAALALGLAAEFETLFALRPQASIAQMERAAHAGRKRAPRRSGR